MDKVYCIYNLKLNVRGDIDMKDVVLNEVKKELNLKERIVVRIFSKTFMKVYNISRIKIVNKML